MLKLLGRLSGMEQRRPGVVVSTEALLGTVLMQLGYSLARIEEKIDAINKRTTGEQHIGSVHDDREVEDAVRRLREEDRRSGSTDIS